MIELHLFFIETLSNYMRFIEFQGDKQLVYAELMLKNPSDGGNPKATNNSTEYAEILYVSPNAEK